MMPSANSPLSALVVDDNKENRYIFTKALQAAGYQTTEAQQGAECLAILKQGIHFDLMILDLRMPVLDGPEVLRQLATPDFAKMRAKMYVIVATGNADLINGEVEKGANDILEKPIQVASFITLVKSLQGTYFTRVNKAI